MKWTSMINILY